jgi:Mlc titration factor MtfA (ptsG expression regulator)
LCGLELLLLGLAGSGRPWLWSVLLTLPLIAALLRRQQRDLQSIVRVFLDQVAKEWQFVAK